MKLGQSFVIFCNFQSNVLCEVAIVVQHRYSVLLWKDNVKCHLSLEACLGKQYLKKDASWDSILLTDEDLDSWLT